jgi:hypothetical protein
MSTSLTLTVNGQSVTRDVPPQTLLVEFIREHLRLTGTHVGCDTAQCGACTVHIDGRAAKSCNVLAHQVAGSSITTIEGLEAADGTLHPMQQAFNLPRPAVRLLHARHGDERRRSAAAPRLHQRGPGARGARGQHLPLHRLPQHRQGGHQGCRRHEGHGLTTQAHRSQAP